MLAVELEKLRNEMKKGREAEETFGFDPKKEMPFFGLLKQEIYGKDPIEKLGKDDIDLLVSLTKDVVEIIKKEIQYVDFWDNYTKQKRLKVYLISHFLGAIQPNKPSKTHVFKVKEEPAPYLTTHKGLLFRKRNEIAQKLLELAYHVYAG